MEDIVLHTVQHVSHEPIKLAGEVLCSERTDVKAVLFPEG